MSACPCLIGFDFIRFPSVNVASYFFFFLCNEVSVNDEFWFLLLNHSGALAGLWFQLWHMGANRWIEVNPLSSILLFSSALLCEIFVCYVTLYAKSLQNSDWLFCASDCKEVMKDFVTKGYKKRLLPLPVSLSILG